MLGRSALPLNTRDFNANVLYTCSAANHLGSYLQRDSWLQVMMLVTLTHAILRCTWDQRLQSDSTPRWWQRSNSHCIILSGDSGWRWCPPFQIDGRGFTTSLCCLDWKFRSNSGGPIVQPSVSYYHHLLSRSRSTINCRQKNETSPFCASYARQSLLVVLWFGEASSQRWIMLVSQ